MTKYEEDIPPDALDIETWKRAAFALIDLRRCRKLSFIEIQPIGSEKTTKVKVPGETNYRYLKTPSEMMEFVDSITREDESK